MKIEVSNDKQIGYLLDALQVLIENAFTRFDYYTMDDIVAIASFHIGIKKELDKLIAIDESTPETLRREPNKGERTILGHPDYIKK